MRLKQWTDSCCQWRLYMLTSDLTEEFLTAMRLCDTCGIQIHNHYPLFVYIVLTSESVRVLYTLCGINEASNVRCEMHL